MTVVIPQIVAERYREAVANPDIARWRSLAYMTAFQADTIQAHEPESEIADDLRTISELAWSHCIDLEPQREPESHDSLAGVIIGWFKGVMK